MEGQAFYILSGYKFLVVSKLKRSDIHLGKFIVWIFYLNFNFNSRKTFKGSN